MARWPEYYEVAVSSNADKMMGYCMGKSEGAEEVRGEGGAKDGRSVATAAAKRLQKHYTILPK